MQGPAHLALSWFTAEGCGFEARRSRRIIAIAGLSPDFDVLAYAGAYAWFGFDRDLAYEKVWITVHHHYTHGLAFALLAGVLAWWAAGRGGAPAGPRDGAARVGLYACLAVLLHVFFDLIAAGARYPVYPLWPLSDLAWTVTWSWELRDWPNQAITIACLAAVVLYARLAGRSPVESVSYRLDAWVVRIARDGTDGSAARAHVTVLGLPRPVVVRVCVYAGLVALCSLVIAPVADDLL